MADEKSEKASQVYAALGIAVVCIVIGVPLWWKTTDTYRVSLPYAEIDQLTMKGTHCSIDVTIVVYDDSVDKADLAIFGENLKEALEVKSTYDLLTIVYRGNMRDAYEDEKMALKKAKTILDLDKDLDDLKLLQDHGKHTFHMLPTKSTLLPSGINVYTGRKRNTFLHTKSMGLDDLNTLVPVFQDTIRNMLVREKAITNTFQSARAAQLLQTDKQSMRSVKSSTGYDVTFTLLNPEPQVVDVRWQIRDGVAGYLQPFIDVMSPFINVTVKSQVLHYTQLTFRAKKENDGSSNYLSQEDLPHLINPIEAKLGSHVSTNPALNFIVYIPTQQQSPLFIHNDKDERSPSNAFLSPRWGGVLINNVPSPSEGDNLPVRRDIHMKTVMETFLAQLKLLLGFPQSSFAAQEEQTEDNTAVALWEIDYWLRSRTLENIATSTATLKSLAQLLEQIKNMVINDDIGLEVEQAVKAISESQQHLSQGNLKEAFLSSKQASISSEKAFFDPSLLELLYFPEDQKFAIYIPLFLPISIPVLLSIVHAYKWFRGKDTKTEKTE